MPAPDLNGKLVTVLGGSGFVGSHIAQELLSRGARLRIASRHPERSHSLRPLANLGQMQFAHADITKPDSLRAVFNGAHGVINLVGAFDGNLDAVQGRGAGRMAKIAAESGVASLVHISAIGADEDSELDYQASKGMGEHAIHQEFPDATILRPSIIFGEDDDFINMFAGLISSAPAMPVFAPEAELQPVHVDDVAEAAVAALADPGRHGGKIYELAGPDRLTMLELNRRIAKAQGRNRTFLPLPDFVGRAFAVATGWLPGAPISRQQYDMLAQGNVASGKQPGFEELGVSPKPLGLFLDKWMTRYRRHGRFSAAKGL